MHTRFALVILAALLALPLAPTASPVGARTRFRTVTRTFSNPAPINLPKFDAGDNPMSGSLYPSTIAVSGLKGRIRDVNLRVNDFSHTYPDDVDVLLVGPRGQTAVVMANVGESGPLGPLNEVTLRLDDEAEAQLPDQTGFPSGAYRPTNATNTVIAFNAPAPSASTNAALSVFDGGNPNGTWSLFVQGQPGPNDFGAFAGGWALEIKAKVKTNKKKR
jgi:subtilisin-like proprotein convertase family protein